MKTAEIKFGQLIEPRIEAIPKQTITSAPLRFFGYLLFSILLPLFALLLYMSYAAANGIVLESGCEGPGIPFSLISGILFALQLRFIELSKSTY